MTAPDEVYREYVRRTHRTMATYLSVLAWSRDLDCVVIERDEIVRFWGIARRVENQRLDWLREDIRHYFAHLQALWFTKGTQKFSSVYLARRPFPKDGFATAASDKQRAEVLTKREFRTAVVVLPAEVVMLTQLTAVIHGLAAVPLQADTK